MTAAVQAEGGRASRAAPRAPRNWAWLGLLPFFAFLALFLIIPAISVFTTSIYDNDGNLSLSTLKNAFSGQNRDAFWFSIRLSALSAGLGVNPHNLDLSIYNLLMQDDVEAEDVVIKTDVAGLHLLPANIDLSAAEIQLVNEVAREMALASGVTIEIDPSKLQFLPGAAEYARLGAIPGGLKNNREFAASCVEGQSELDDLLYDPQTSGGLLISLPGRDAAELERAFPAAYVMGRATVKSGKPIRIL